MDLTGYNAKQLDAMQDLAALWIHENKQEIDRCISTLRAVNHNMQTFNESVTAKRVSSKIITTMTERNIDPMFAHTIRDMIYEFTTNAARVASTYEDFRVAARAIYTHEPKSK